MKLSDFILLGENEKKQTVLHQGILVGKRFSPDHLMFLFQLNSYYVETYCSLQNREIVEYRVFDNTSLLGPYLEEISLEGLLN